MIIEKFKVLSVLLFVAAIFSAFVVAPALADWAVDGKPISQAEGSLATESEGELELSHLGLSSVLCKDLLVGSVGPNVGGEVKEVLNLSKEAIGTGLVGLALLCTSVTTCEKVEDIEVWPDHLPWSTELEGMAGEAPILNRIFGTGSGKEPGWTVSCLVIGISVEEECTGETSAKVENSSENAVLESFNPAAPIESQEVTCKGSEHVGSINGQNLTLLVSGKILTVEALNVELINRMARNFGSVSISMTKHTINTFLFENKATLKYLTIEINNITPLGEEPGFFLVGPKNTCEGKTFEPGAECGVDVTFAPPHEEPYLGVLLVNYEIGGQARTYSVAFLNGVGIK